MIDISWITQGGFSNWTAVMAFRMKAITAPSWKRKTVEIEEKQELPANARSNPSLNGYRQPQGRQSKSKARIARFEELNSKDFQKRNETQELYIPPGERLGDEVIEVSGWQELWRPCHQ